MAAIERFRRELDCYIKYRWSIIFIEAFDFPSIMKELHNALRNNKMENISAKEWSAGFGENTFRNHYREADGGTLIDTLQEFVDENNKILLLKDINNELQENAAVRSLLQQYVFYNEQLPLEKRSIIIILSSIYRPPAGMEKLFHRLIYPYPDNKDIENELLNGGYIISDYIKNKKLEWQKLICSLQGMQLYEIRSMLKYINHNKGKILPSHIDIFYEEKKRIVRDSGVMEIVDSNISLNKIGGLENLIEYLKKKKEIMSRPDLKEKYKLPPSKGVLLVGSPGCGKTIMAKAIASFFKYPLLRLDIGKLMGMYVGESEHNLALAISVAEAAQPCVLWIDEIEKAFAGANGQNADITVRRMIGTFLTWMQERKSNVYIAATANSIDANVLPPELTRKGRLDDIFYVTYPTAKEREKIFELHLRRYNLKISEEDLKNIASNDKTDFFSGAEIETLVQRACENYIQSNEIENRDTSIINEMYSLLTNKEYIFDSIEIENRKNSGKNFLGKGFIPASR